MAKSGKDIASEIKQALDLSLAQAATTRNEAILTTLGLLVLGSPVLTGRYSLNHRIAVNDEVEDPELFEGTSAKQLENNPVNITGEAQIARERPKLTRTSLADTVSIVNEVPWAEFVENRTNNYEIALANLNALLDRDLAGEGVLIQ